MRENEDPKLPPCVYNLFRIAQGVRYTKEEIKKQPAKKRGRPRKNEK